MKIAVVQHEVIPGRVEENRAKAIAFAREALLQNPDVILFPEEMLVGYVANLRELAEPVDGPTSRAFASLLKGTKTKAILGLTERAGDDCFVSAALVDESGALANYRKTHLWWDAEGLRHEPSFYRAGDKLVTFDIAGHRCGVMICYDGDFPEMARAYANLGCSVLFWLNNRRSRGHNEVRELARLNSIIIAAACCSGKDEVNVDCPGGSNITGADGKLIAEIWNRDGVIFADVDAAHALRLREKTPWHRGQRQDLYR